MPVASKLRTLNKCLKAIDDLIDGHSVHLHFLLYRLSLICDVPEKVIRLRDIELAIDEIQKSFVPAAEVILNTLTANQKNLLESIVTETTKFVYSKKYIERSHLAGRSTLLVALKALQSQGLVTQNSRTGEYIVSVSVLAD